MEGVGELHVLIKEAKNLMAMKPGGTSDSFVKGLVIKWRVAFPIQAFLYSGPDCVWLCRYLFPITAKSTKKKTPVVKKNLNPHYDHTFVYKELALEQLQDMSLELTVWDREAISSNEFLGGVRLSSGEGKRHFPFFPFLCFLGPTCMKWFHSLCVT